MGIFRFVFLTILLLSGFQTGTLLADHKFSVFFLNPGAKEDFFFQRMSTFMEAAAKNLQIDLKIAYCNRNHLKIYREAKKVIDGEELPDYMILINEKNAVSKVLPMANNKGIKTLIINEGFFDTSEDMGEPRAKFENWLGELLPDDYHAGYMLSRSLIQQALANRKEEEKDKPLEVVAITGTHKTESAMFRVQGMKNAIAAFPNVKLRQVVHAYWERERAKNITFSLLKRYPNAKVIWAASDGMALGVTDALAVLGKTAGKEIHTGGIDWASFAFDKVKEGTFTATVGGHFMDGAWGLIMLYDYHHGKDFPRYQNKSPFFVVTQKNVDRYAAAFSSNQWSKIDFSRFSKVHNTTIKEYPFHAEKVLSQLKN